jgi:hypothetical protein
MYLSKTNWYAKGKTRSTMKGLQPAISTKQGRGGLLPQDAYKTITGVVEPSQKQTSRRKGLEFFNCDYP